MVKGRALLGLKSTGNCMDRVEHSLVINALRNPDREPIL